MYLLTYDCDALCGDVMGVAQRACKGGERGNAEDAHHGRLLLRYGQVNGNPIAETFKTDFGVVGKEKLLGHVRVQVMVVRGI